MSTVDYDSIRSLISDLIEDNTTQQITPLDVRASLNAVLTASQRIDNEGTNYSQSSYWYANLVDLENSDYYYFGGVNSQLEWKINRNSKANPNDPYQSATIQNNPGIIDIVTAWNERFSLVYG